MKVTRSSAEIRCDPPGEYRLELSNITKHYPGVRANDAITLRLRPGEIHAVLGENGAGKSTLMKIIYGVVQADVGELRWNGNAVDIRSPQQARALGINMVFQHFNLFDTLTVAENIWLGLDRRSTLAEVRTRIDNVASAYGLDVEPLRPVHTLSVGERQRVEIVRALLTKPQLLILDEPTSVLTAAAIEKLFATLRQLANQGCSILYISHKLDEIRALAQRCTVLRQGKVVGVVEPAHESTASLARLMLGAEPRRLPHRPAAPGALALAVRQLMLAKANPFGVNLSAIDLAVRAGEIVGIAGVSGNGQEELIAALSGEDRRAPPGSIRLFDADIAQWPPAARRTAGLRFVVEERLGRGAVPTLSLAANILLTRTDSVARSGWIRTRRATALAEHLLQRFAVRAAGPNAAAKSLSGGNLQKFLVGREIDAEPKVLIVAQPTWGLDVGAATQIRRELLALRDRGCALLVVSEEIDELFEICDRLVVMAEGKVSPSVGVGEATPELIGLWLSGRWPERSALEVDDVAA